MAARSDVTGNEFEFDLGHKIELVNLEKDEQLYL
jgi:hypothetical protein